MQCYVDDILAGTNEKNDLEALFSQLNTLLSSHGFSLLKWCSNSRRIHELIPQENISNLNLDFEDSPNKVLRLKWNPSGDFLSNSIPNSPNLTRVTKRNILSCIAQCYDPLGLLAPVIVSSKLLLFIFSRTVSVLEFHGFADASIRAYAACVYVRAIYADGQVSSNLISSKSRVAPLKTISLPKLKLYAMLLLSQLITKLIDIFKGHNTYPLS